MPRIVAGAARGRRLVAPPGDATRPTSDRVREAMFSTVEALLGQLRGARVLDLYAGTGALGLEALSRGAAHALLVEEDRRAVRAIRANVAAVACPGAEVRPCDVAWVLAGRPDRPYDLVLADPPYATPEQRLAEVLARLLPRGAAESPGWLAPHGLVVLERPSRAGPPPWPAGVSTVRDRRYGGTALWYGRLAA